MRSQLLPPSFTFTSQANLITFYFIFCICSQAYLKKTKWERHVVKNQEVYEKAFAEFCLWFLRHSHSLQSHKVQNKYPPQAIPTHALLELLKESPPGEGFSYQVLGLESWEDFAHGIDIGAKGYFTKTDINMYWEKFGIRDVHMKNRESTTIKGLGSFLQVSQTVG